MEEILVVKNLQKYFRKKGSQNGEIVRAVDGVSFSIKNGKTLVLAGESGSGKTTIARLVLKAIEQDMGEIIFDGINITNQKETLRKLRTECQMIHQDPYSSINPRMTIFDIIKEPLEINAIGNRDEQRQRVLHALAQVKLEPIDDMLEKYPHMLSGGQRQRVAIARAIITNPKIVIADEPVSMLDVSVRIGILELLKELQENLGISFLYITHDLTTAKYIGHRIAILYLGKIIEIGPINEVITKPLHPYTQALIDSISEPDPDNLYKEKKIRINNPKNINVYSGCRFQARCPYAIDKCNQEPLLEDINDRQVACFVKLT